MASKKKSQRITHGPRGADDLTGRTREFVRLRRLNPEAPGHEIMSQAGFLGTDVQLKERARQLMRKPKVAAAIIAPLEPHEVPKELTDEDLKKLIRKRLHAVLINTKATDADAIKAADKLLATIVGGYVPVQVKTQGSVTLESWVRGMGGAPTDDRPQLSNGEDHEQTSTGG